MAVIKEKKVHCLACKHLGITWNPTTPYFCRAWSIRSKNYPCEDVFSASGITCQKFEPKPVNNSSQGGARKTKPFFSKTKRR
ncbi:MAG: hypothetical protein WHS38_06515 [Thermodesulforhabdaceae bacterium]|jgi:hypothetical protein